MKKRIELNPNFWNCKCKENYVKSSIYNECPLCNAKRDEQPNTEQSEVMKHIYKKYNMKKDIII